MRFEKILPFARNGRRAKLKNNDRFLSFKEMQEFVMPVGWLDSDDWELEPEEITVKYIHYEATHHTKDNFKVTFLVDKKHFDSINKLDKTFILIPVDD